ncbi:MAG: GNAT family N-acetyltransferase [Patescibacteria group bacterium]|nr:GNAT family N-acetyltransferase [Patescibacteria group bacterium]
MSLDIQLIKPEDIHKQNDFICVYQEVFAGAPYFEKWESTEIQSMMDHWFEIGNAYVSVAYIDGNPIAIAAGVPLVAEQKRYNALKLEDQYMHLVDSIFYNVEVAVLPSCRGRGIASQLIDNRILFAQENEFSHLVFITIEEGSLSEPLYLKKGFQRITNLLVPEIQNGINGEDVHYNNVFLIKEI